MAKIILPIILAVLMGLLAWYMIEPIGPDNEHWDNPLYWQLAYPAICIGCCGLGFLFPKNSWSHGLLA